MLDDATIDTKVICFDHHTPSPPLQLLIAPLHIYNLLHGLLGPLRRLESLDVRTQLGMLFLREQSAPLGGPYAETEKSASPDVTTGPVFWKSDWGILMTVSRVFNLRVWYSRGGFERGGSTYRAGCSS